MKSPNTSVMQPGSGSEHDAPVVSPTALSHQIKLSSGKTLDFRFSEAFARFRESLLDIERLRSLHRDIGGPAPGRRYGLEVINKSAIVLITAIWEAFCEDLASEALKLLVENAEKADVLPKYLKQQIAAELKNDKNDLAIWKLTDDGWRNVMMTRLDQLRDRRNRRLNAPKSIVIDNLFLEAIGLDKISNCWELKKTSASDARTKLDRYVELRGAIAHRGTTTTPCRSSDVEDYFMHVRRLAGSMVIEVNRFVEKATGKRWHMHLFEFAEAHYPRDTLARKTRQPSTTKGKPAQPSKV
jgi:hypothetical protein